MAERPDPKEIIARFLQDASEEEVEELYRLLKEREKNPGKGMKVNDIARRMSAELMNRMGIDGKSVRSIARGLVADLALQYNPDLTDGEIRQLVKHLVPEKKALKLPPDIIRAMTAHIVSYSKGTMSERDRSELKEGWIEKYWRLLPHEARELVKSYLNGKIDEETLWLLLNHYLEGQQPFTDSPGDA